MVPRFQFSLSVRNAVPDEILSFHILPCLRIPLLNVMNHHLNMSFLDWSVSSEIQEQWTIQSTICLRRRFDRLTPAKFTVDWSVFDDEKGRCWLVGILYLIISNKLYDKLYRRRQVYIILVYCAVDEINGRDHLFSKSIGVLPWTFFKMEVGRGYTCIYVVLTPTVIFTPT